MLRDAFYILTVKLRYKPPDALQPTLAHKELHYSLFFCQEKVSIKSTDMVGFLSEKRILDL